MIEIALGIVLAFILIVPLPPKDRHRIWYASPSKTGGKDRSRFYPGIARAMADQWGVATRRQA